MFNFCSRQTRCAKPLTRSRRFCPTVELLEALDLPSTVGFNPPLNNFAQEFRGDFNGDRQVDVAAFDEQGRWVVSLSNGTSFRAPQSWAQWDLPGAWREMFIGDFNGDGRDDVAGFSASTVEGKWWVGLSNGTDQFQSGPWATWAVAPLWDSLFVGDFNGDVREDVAGIDINGKWWVGLSNGSNAFATPPPWASWSIPAVWDRFFVGDFNGDSLDDILGFANSGRWWVGLSTNSRFDTQLPWAQWSIPASWDSLYLGDFDGDARDDIAGFAFNGTWWVGLSNSINGFDTGPAWATWSSPANWSQLFVGDIDGDSRDDVVGFGVNGNWAVGLTNALDAFTTSQNPWGQWSAPEYWQEVLVGDFSGDGRDDVAGFAFDDAWWIGVSNGTNRFAPSLWVDWVV